MKNRNKTKSKLEEKSHMGKKSKPKLKVSEKSKTDRKSNAGKNKKQPKASI